MEQLRLALQSMIMFSEQEFEDFSALCYEQKYRRKDILSKPGQIPQEVFFITKGIIRVVIVGVDGTAHTMYFAMENQFIADYSAFIQNEASIYTLEALENTETIVLTREAIEWGYVNMRQGDRLGRLIAEYYFKYHDNRIKIFYARTPKQRYDTISEIFPNIHNRVPQHMIASYLGITPVHLSRLKKL